MTRLGNTPRSFELAMRKKAGFYSENSWNSLHRLSIRWLNSSKPEEVFIHFRRFLARPIFSIEKAISGKKGVEMNLLQNDVWDGRRTNPKVDTICTFKKSGPPDLQQFGWFHGRMKFIGASCDFHDRCDHPTFLDPTKYVAMKLQHSIRFSHIKKKTQQNLSAFFWFGWVFFPNKFRLVPPARPSSTHFFTLGQLCRKSCHLLIDFFWNPTRYPPWH